MVLPALLVGAGAIRSNVLERRALAGAGREHGADPDLRRAGDRHVRPERGHLALPERAGSHRHARSSGSPARWSTTGSNAGPPSSVRRRWALAEGVADIQRQIQTAADSIFRLYDAGQRQAAFTVAQRELKGRLLPALTQMNREIYRQARESSVRGAYARLEEILADAEPDPARDAAPVARRRAARLLAHLPQPGPAAQRSSPAPWRSSVRASWTTRSPPPRATRSGSWRGPSADDRQAARVAERPAPPQCRAGDEDLPAGADPGSAGAVGEARVHRRDVGRRRARAAQSARQSASRRPAGAAASRGALRHAEHLDAIIEEVDRLDRRISHLLELLPPGTISSAAENVRRLVDGLLPRSPSRFTSEESSCSSSSRRAARGPGGPDADGAGPARDRLQRARRDAAGRAAPDRRLAWRTRQWARPRSSSRSPTPARGFPTRSCPRSASRSSPLGRRAPDWDSRSPNGTSSRTAAAWRSTSRPGGTTVRVRLPAAAAEATA